MSFTVVCSAAQLFIALRKEGRERRCQTTTSAVWPGHPAAVLRCSSSSSSSRVAHVLE